MTTQEKTDKVPPRSLKGFSEGSRINQTFHLGLGSRSSQLDFYSHPWRTLSTGLTVEGESARGQSSLLDRSSHFTLRGVRWPRAEERIPLYE